MLNACLWEVKISKTTAKIITRISISSCVKSFLGQISPQIPHMRHWTSDGKNQTKGTGIAVSISFIGSLLPSLNRNRWLGSRQKVNPKTAHRHCGSIVTTDSNRRYSRLRLLNFFRDLDLLPFFTRRKCEGLSERSEEQKKKPCGLLELRRRPALNGSSVEPTGLESVIFSNRSAAAILLWNCALNRAATKQYNRCHLYGEHVHDILCMYCTYRVDHGLCLCTPAYPLGLLSVLRMQTILIFVVAQSVLGINYKRQWANFYE